MLEKLLVILKQDLLEVKKKGDDLKMPHKMKKGMKMYEVTRVKRTGATGSRIGVYSGTSRRAVAAYAARQTGINGKIRVFPVKLVKKRR